MGSALRAQARQAARGLGQRWLSSFLEQPDAAKRVNEAGLDVRQTVNIFDSLHSDDSGELAVTEFCEGVLTNRGEAKAKDIPEEEKEQTATPPWQTFWKQKKDKRKKTHNDI